LNLPSIISKQFDKTFVHLKTQTLLYFSLNLIVWPTRIKHQWIPILWLNGKHCMFGLVVESLDVVQAVETVGSQSGATKAPVVIADSGQFL